MAKIVSPAPPFHVTQTADEWCVALPAWRVPEWKAGLLYAAIMSIGSCGRDWARSKSDPSFDLTPHLLAAIPVFFITAVFFGLFMVVSNRFSGQEVRVGSQSFQVRYRFAGIIQTYTFDLSDVRNVRFVEPHFWDYVKQKLRDKKRVRFAEVNSGGEGSRALCFDYHGRTVQFGAGLDEAGARELLSLLLEHLPTSAAPLSAPAISAPITEQAPA